MEVTDVIALVCLVFFIACLIAAIIFIFKLVRAITGVSDVIYGISDGVGRFFERRKNRCFRFQVKRKGRSLIDIGYRRDRDDES